MSDVRAEERKGQAGVSAIQSRAKGADEKTPAGQDADVIGARLWALGSPTPLADYGSPWDSVGADLWGRLLGALAAPAARRVAAPASLLGYAGCAKALLRGAPAVHRVVTDIRGLALAAAPATVEAARAPAPAPAPKNEQPGEPLVYDDIAVH